MCPTVPGKPQSLQGVPLNVKVDIISINAMIVQVLFEFQELSKIFPYKLMINASIIHTISAYERFHKNALLLEGRGNLYADFLLMQAHFLIPQCGPLVPGINKQNGKPHPQALRGFSFPISLYKSKKKICFQKLTRLLSTALWLAVLHKPMTNGTWNSEEMPRNWHS